MASNTCSFVSEAPQFSFSFRLFLSLTWPPGAEQRHQQHSAPVIICQSGTRSTGKAVTTNHGDIWGKICKICRKQRRVVVAQSVLQAFNTPFLVSFWKSRKMLDPAQAAQARKAGVVARVRVCTSPWLHFIRFFDFVAYVCSNCLAVAI